MCFVNLQSYVIPWVDETDAYLDGHSHCLELGRIRTFVR